jgi:outer membrane protein
MAKDRLFYRFSTAVLFVVISPMASTQDLLDTYMQALEKDALLKRSLAQRDANRTAAPSALANMLPTVNMQANSNTNNPAVTSDQIFEPGTAAGTTIIRDHGYVINATQDLINVGSWFTLKQAGHIVDQADATYTYAEQNLILRTAEAYFDVLDAIDNLSFAQAEKNSLEQELHQSQEKFNVGLVAITDLNDFRARFDDSVSREIQALNMLDDAKERLRIITGDVIDVLAPLKDKIPLNTPDPNDIDTWQEYAQQNNPLLASTRFDMEAKRSAVEVTRAQHYPTINVQGSYGADKLGLVTNPGDVSDLGWQLLFQAQMNLYAGGGIQASVNKAQYTFEDARYAFEEARRETISNTRIAYRGVLTAISQVHALRQSVISAQSALDANQASYDVGAKTSIDVLNSLSNLYNQQRNFAKARYAYIINVLSLKQAAGTLSLADVELVNTWLSQNPVLPGNNNAVSAPFVDTGIKPDVNIPVTMPVTSIQPPNKIPKPSTVPDKIPEPQTPMEKIPGPEEVIRSGAPVPPPSTPIPPSQ